MSLPATIEPFIIGLPWEVTIGGWTGDSFQCSFTQGVSRFYGANMQAATYLMTGPDPAFDADFTCLMQRYSMNFEAPTFLAALMKNLCKRIVRAQVNPYVIADKPANVPTPVGIGYPLTSDIWQYLNGGGSSIPVPLGLYSAFRVLPVSEYAGATESVGLYRGETPPI